MKHAAAHKMAGLAGLSPIRSVVIDDNPILLKVWQRVLNNDGHRAFVTNDPEEALNKIDEACAEQAKITRLRLEKLIE